MMEIEEKYKTFLKFMNEDIIDEEILEKILANCQRVLLSEKEIHDIENLRPNAQTQMKQLYAALLHTLTQFVRNGESNEDLSNFLTSDCNIPRNKATIIDKFYENSYEQIRIQLLNIGNHLPHITDVKWKIDHVVKSNSLDHSDGPIFRVSLKTEKYDPALEDILVNYIDFTCNCEELQDLVFKLKQAVKHCNKMSVGHH